ncbi:MAG: heavy metal transporter [Firmicutes bacterium]|nr:heavy metal transporter [Bacillota bacterium]
MAEGKKVTKKLYLTGMTCTSCETRIEKGLRKLPGVSRVSADYQRMQVEVEFYGDQTDIRKIVKTIENLGYEASTTEPPRKGSDTRMLLGFLVIAAAVYLIIKNTIGFNFIPQIDQSMGWGLLFLAGLLTSLHCVAMCGGIVISQTTQTDGNEKSGIGGQLWPGLQYNLGRVMSYTLIGGLAGALGSTISFSGTARGAVAIVSGVLMFILGLNMLGIFRWTRRLPIRLPGWLGVKLSRLSIGRRPFYIGLLNGLMPCGPLQAMQLYALGAGSFLAGAGSMLAFALGTVPLLFTFGALNSLLSARFTRGMLKASAVLVSVLGLVMLSRGLALSGVDFRPQTALTAASAAQSSEIQDGVQVVRTEVDQYYTPSVQVLQKGVPVRWIINAKSLNGCNNPITIPKLNITKKLVLGENVVEFTPEESGSLVYSCWMGMITGNFLVVDDVKQVKPEDLDQLNTVSGTGGVGSGGCCGPIPPRFKDGKIPVDELAVAKVKGSQQEVEIRVDQNGYSPAVIVVQRGVPTVWKIEAENLNSCTYVMVFPDYQEQVPLKEGTNELRFTPEKDFSFQCSMGMLNGYVKVVDDLNQVNQEQIAREIGQIEPRPRKSCCG